MPSDPQKHLQMRGSGFKANYTMQKATAFVPPESLTKPYTKATELV